MDEQTEKKERVVRPTGTREWSQHSCNIQNGCGHRCRYCYARANALRFGRITSQKQWGTTYHHVRPRDVSRKRTQLDGRVMFPTAHDIEPKFIGPCIQVLRNLLAAENEVLIVSKPHGMCIVKLCEELREFRDQITFRFSIGATDKTGILAYWEPGAPAYHERVGAMSFAYSRGFRTSVSCEPFLDTPSNAATLYRLLEPVVTDTIWFGKLNQIRKRCLDASEDAIAEIEVRQTDEAVEQVYRSLKDEPKVRWKDSYTKALGLPAQTG